ncbi:hypothetical protein XACN24_08220 [Xanthomonas albilineans]|uniref:Hypothetical_protein n=1 Tax=Xanthomonas albilineans (strain GPE PC73 / CFBP 7063) TaxID=380358 RepID=D2UDV9_XANAP|nr:hypothetical protein [Xanthomonas albilineans]CBA16193.1 hypothetical_protein [Xanthomonas albilineans GPE PC73]
MENKLPFRDELASKFRAETETISACLLVFCEITHSKAIQHMDSALLRWLDFRLRFVDPKPRPLVYSKSFPRRLYGEVGRALAVFEQYSLAGEDLNPFQGKGLTKHHDTSGIKSQNRTDLLWADWGIHHFHLVPRSGKMDSYYADRSEHLLFAVVFDNVIACLDIKSHEAMENRALLEAFVRSWPDEAERFRLKGAFPQHTAQFSEADIKKLRHAGIASTVTVDDAIYMPGGITCASTPTRVTLAYWQTARGADAIAHIAINEVIRDRGAWQEADLPHLSLALTPRGIGICDDRSNKCWQLPRAKGEWADHPVGRWHDLMLPEWIEGKVAEAVAKTRV